MFMTTTYVVFTVALASETRDAFGFEFSPKWLDRTIKEDICPGNGLNLNFEMTTLSEDVDYLAVDTQSESNDGRISAATWEHEDLAQVK